MTKAWQLVAVAALAGLLLVWNLGGVSLWQDEAATAVLAQRMLKFGKPLAYDGRNLITMDYKSDDETSEILLERTQSAAASVRYFHQRGDYKADTTWIGQPWGQFVLTAASFQLLGSGTWQARMPFALCGGLTVLVLFGFILRRFDALTAWLAVGLLLGNVYWLLHMRQCRYYAPSSLLLLSVFVCYWGWQTGGKWSRIGFACLSWLLFQCDYGIFVPLLGVLLAESLWAHRRLRVETLAMASVVVLTVLPWFFYYELAARLKPSSQSYGERLLGLSFSVNHFVLPLIVFLGALFAAWFDRRQPLSASVTRSRLVCVAAIVIAVSVPWMAFVAPFPFHRYVVGLTPLGAWLAAYAITVAAAGLARFARQARWKTPLAGAAAALLIFTPWLSLPVTLAVPPPYRTIHHLNPWVRAEFQRLSDNFLGTAPDPTRELVAALQHLASPDDELLVNADEIPLIFYTNRLIRGGIATFRVNDPAARRSVLIYRYAPDSASQPMIQAEVDKRAWTLCPVHIPDIARPNCPDPFTNYLEIRDPPEIVVALPGDPVAAPASDGVGGRTGE